MACVRSQYSICFLTWSALLLFRVSVHDVEASCCQKVFHKKVGDTVEFSSCLPSEGVAYAEWRLGHLMIAEKDVKVSENPQFKDRLNLNPTDFNLTVTRLTLQDSGYYSFISGYDTNQRPTVIITLQVHEPITTQPVLTSNSTWHSRNESCTFLLECSATSDISRVTYKWTVGNRSMNGSTLQYYTRKKDGDIIFTCTVSNYVSEMSTSETFKCSNDTDELSSQETMSSFSTLVHLILWPVIGILLIIVTLISLLVYMKSKDLLCHRLIQSPSTNQSLSTDQTVNQDESSQQVYSSLLHGDLSVYETMTGSNNTPNGRQDDPLESSDYYNLDPQSATGP